MIISTVLTLAMFTAVSSIIFIVDILNQMRFYSSDTNTQAIFKPIFTVIWEFNDKATLLGLVTINILILPLTMVWVAFALPILGFCFLFVK